MVKEKFKRFIDNSVITCPNCSSVLKLNERSLICSNNHCFDIAKQGYVNLLQGSKKYDNYDKASFENRKTVLEAGLYDAILEFIIEYIGKFPEKENILDVGCGEGYYSNKIAGRLHKNTFAFDISKDSIALAARADRENLVKWFVSDLAHIAVKDGSMDFILDIFSPANYDEFSRILKSDGRLIKVVPGENHLAEIRNKVKSLLKNSDYSNKRVIDCFSDSFDIDFSERLTYSCKLSPETLQALIEMTPLLFNVDTDKIDWSDIDEVTIDAEILVGKDKNR